MHGSGKSPMNGWFHTKITDFSGPFSSTPCLITEGTFERGNGTYSASIGYHIFRQNQGKCMVQGGDGNLRHLICTTLYCWWFRFDNWLLSEDVIIWQSSIQT